MAFLASSVKIKIQSNTANSVSITGVTNGANTIIACANSFDVGDIVVIDDTIVGIPKLKNAIARVAARTAANVTLEGLNSVDWGTYVSGGTIKEVSQWIEFDNITNFSYPEPQPNRQQILTIHDEQAAELFGADSPSQVTMDTYADPFNAAVVEVRKTALAKDNRAYTLIFKNGYTLYVNAQSAGGQGVQASAGQPVTAQISLAFQSTPVWYRS